MATNEGRLRVLREVKEPDWQAQVERWMAREGWWLYHTRDSRGSEAGWPDLVALRRGRLLVAELKAFRGHVTPTQENCLNQFREVPCAEVFVWRPQDEDLVREILR